MAWWQKKLLQYALSRTGLLDETAINLDNYDIAFGRKNVVELRNVGLNIKQIAKLAHLPPGVRVETARILTLRLTLPADIYRSSIVAEVDGVHLDLSLEAEESAPKQERAKKSESTSQRKPEHRKVHRRLHSPPPYDPGALSDSDDEVHIPTTQEVAKSFLMQEPENERRQLEASLAADSKSVDESVMSESSESGEVGVGTGIGLPSFLSGFLQGVIDRVQVRISNVEVKVTTQLPKDAAHTFPVALRIRIASAELESLDSSRSKDNDDEKRQVTVHDISLDLVSEQDVFLQMSEIASQPSPERKRRSRSPLSQPEADTRESKDLREELSAAMTEGQASPPTSLLLSSQLQQSGPRLEANQHDSTASVGSESVASSRPALNELDIQPGDDNISWGSRRSKSSAPTEDLWSSMASEEELPESLLLDRAATPRPETSRNASPAATRSRRAVSPYDRSLQSPGSWPRLDDSLERERVRPSPGSWPAMDQSQQSMFQPLTPGPAMELDDPMDNKRAALEASSAGAKDSTPASESLASLPEPAEGEIDNMAQSRFYSHEEAESLYMSAMTQSPKMDVPGGWSSEGTPSDHLERPGQIDGSVVSSRMNKESPEASVGLEHDEVPSGHDTPRAQTPQQASEARIDDKLTSKRLISIDQASIRFPLRSQENAPEPAPAPSRRTPTTSGASARGMPGTFSAYSEVGASHYSTANSAFLRPRSQAQEADDLTKRQEDSRQSVKVSLGTLAAQVDLAACRLLYKVAVGAGQRLTSGHEAHAKKKSAPNKPSKDVSMPMTIAVASLKVSLLEQLPADELSSHDVGLVDLHLMHISAESEAASFNLQVAQVKAWLSGSELLAFDKQSTLGSSVIFNDSRPDVSISLASDKVTIQQRPVTDIGVETNPINFQLDLGALDDTLSSFGGLSGVLELSNSLLSDASPLASPVASKPAKGVRFQGDPELLNTGALLKVNARLGGLNATLRGESCAVNLRTTTLKAVYREQMIAASLDHVILTGPHLAGKSSAPLAIDVSHIRLEYASAPQDRDLERLVSLVNPSKDKYDDTDDILVDILLSQRRKGPIARLAVDGVKVKVDDFELLTPLTALAAELEKLAVVAKYLPEDERPGLLSLVKVKDIQLQLPVNNSFGKIHVNAQDFHCAHVGLPLLFAFSLGDLSAARQDQEQLMHALLPQEASSGSPIIMVRMLGDEEEPTVKIKLFNVCLEYSVPTLVALTGRPELTAEEAVTELAQSVADITMKRQATDDTALKSTPTSDSKKRTKVDLLVHDSGIALTPEKLPSKALVLLANAKIMTHAPPEPHTKVSLELRKAGLFVTDDRHMEEGARSGRGAPSNTAVSSQLTTALAKQGYVSVASMMAAKVHAEVKNSTEGNDSTVEVDVSNELLLLETCADSTQTLMATLGALAPPAAPSKQPQYLTQPMTIEDMMSSFTGDAFTKPEVPPETLFDVEEEPSDAMLDMPTLENEDDDLLMESEMTQSLYGPVSGMLGGLDDPEDDDTATNEFEGTAESLLEEEDPFEMTVSPTDTGYSDAALMRDLAKQSKPAAGVESVELGNYEIEDLGFDALGASQQALGSHHRFNGPTVGRRKVRGDAHAKQALPFRLHLHDTHLIWNLYDGYDWQRTREGITQAVEEVEARAEERKAKRRRSHHDPDEDESVIGDFLFNSIYVGVPANADAQDLRRQINRGIDDLVSETESVPVSGMSRPTTHSASGRPLRQQHRRRLKLERSKTHKVAFELKGVSADLLVFPPESQETVSSVDLRVRDFEIFDNVPSSTWRKFLTALHDGPKQREMAKPMAHIELQTVRTLQDYAAAELILRVAVLPLRLHVDQDALDFITRFFEFKDEDTPKSENKSDQPFIQRLEVETVDLCLDYKPKRLDYGGLRSGHTNELMNIITLDAANICLKHAIVYGIKGFDPIHKTLNDIWMPDIQRNQLPTVLAGLAPVRSLVNIGTGVRDVIAIPVREYRKDGRIVRSIQKGALHFGKTTTSELARLGAKLAIGTQNILQGAEGLLSPAAASPSSRPSVGRRGSSEQGWHDVTEDEEQRAISAYSNQPVGVLSGLRSARAYLERDLLTARDAFIAVQGEVLESASPGGAAAAIARHAPTVILRPVIGASRAVGTTLLGVGNQIDRQNLRKADDKYKRR